MRHNSPIFRGFSGPASALLNEPAMMKHGFFRREVEVFLRASTCALVLSAFVATLAWGYHQRQQAHAWRASVRVPLRRSGPARDVPR